MFDALPLPAKPPAKPGENRLQNRLQNRVKTGEKPGECSPPHTPLVLTPSLYARATHLNRFDLAFGETIGATATHRDRSVNEPLPTATTGERYGIGSWVRRLSNLPLSLETTAARFRCVRRSRSDLCPLTVEQTPWCAFLTHQGTYPASRFWPRRDEQPLAVGVPVSCH